MHGDFKGTALGDELTRHLYAGISAKTNNMKPLQINFRFGNGKSVSDTKKLVGEDTFTATCEGHVSVKWRSFVGKNVHVGIAVDGR